MNGPVVVFDLDGTLVDSAPGIARVLGEMCDERDRPPCTVESVRRWISGGANALITSALSVDSSSVASALLEFRERYGRTPTDISDMYPGTVSALRDLSTAGARLGVCSNKPHALTEKVLSELGIRSLFHGVAGGDAVESCKPSPMHLRETLARMGCAGRPFVFIGDSVVDADAADAAGARFLWVSYGYGERIDLEHRGEAVESAEAIVDVVLARSK